MEQERRVSELWRVVTARAVFGLVVEDGYVVQAAPIAKWAIGKWWPVVAAYYERKGAKVTRV